MKSKPLIRNVVTTANLEQKINLMKLAKLSCGIYDIAIYGGRCGYVKTPGMDGRVTIFSSGKMISIGGKSIQKSIEQLNHAKFYLSRENMIYDTDLKPIIQNIVATIDMGQKIPIDRFSSKMTGAIYNPETFPGMILKGLNSCTFLIFASGKIVIVGAKSLKEINTSLFELYELLNIFPD